MTSDTQDVEALKLGYRRANLAALYAHLRSLIAATLRDDDPVVGLHAMCLSEKGFVYSVSAGATPTLDRVLSGIGSLQGLVTIQAVARMVGDLKQAQVGDQFDPALGKTRCIGCDDGDPDGSHAQEELRRNAQACLGMVVEMTQKFYGDFLSEKARVALGELKAEALPADVKVS